MSQIKIVRDSLTFALVCPLENSPCDSAVWVTVYFSWVELRISHRHPEGKGSRLDVPASGSTHCPAHGSASHLPAAHQSSRPDPRS